MATRQMMGTTVFDQAIDRMIPLYRDGHRVVVSFSGGKDSTCVLNVCLIAAAITGRLPVEVVLCDEEIAYPGTYEYAERVAARPDVAFTWLVINNLALINCFNRENPYWWVFDDALRPDQWVRSPPTHLPHCNVTRIGDDDADLAQMTTIERFPPAPGKNLYAVIGLRVQESKGRLFGLYSSGGYLTKAPNEYGTILCRPIYDWNDGDVWKAINDNGWDYAKCYDTFMSMGIPRMALRIAPPTENPRAMDQLGVAAKAWPAWFDKVCERIPGARTGAQYGKRAVTPQRHPGETWEQAYQRECVDEAPAWIADRARRTAVKYVKGHARHATTPLPEVTPCQTCTGALGSWRKLAMSMYLGDPGCQKVKCVPKIKSNFFRGDK